MDYVYAERVGEVEVEHSFHDITISDWITINSLLVKKNKEPMKVASNFKMPDSFPTMPVYTGNDNRWGVTVSGGLKE